MIKSPGTGKKTGRRQQNPPRSSRNQTRRRKSRPDGEEKNQRLRRRPRPGTSRGKKPEAAAPEEKKELPAPEGQKEPAKSLEITAAAAGGSRQELLRQPQEPREPWPLWRQRGRKTGENLLYWLKMAGRAASPEDQMKAYRKYMYVGLPVLGVLFYLFICTGRPLIWSIPIISASPSPICRTCGTRKSFSFRIFSPGSR